jgi:hypothetical protein
VIDQSESSSAGGRTVAHEGVFVADRAAERNVSDHGLQSFSSFGGPLRYLGDDQRVYGVVDHNLCISVPDDGRSQMQWVYFGLVSQSCRSSPGVGRATKTFETFAPADVAEAARLSLAITFKMD